MMLSPKLLFLIGSVVFSCGNADYSDNTFNKIDTLQNKEIKKVDTDTLPTLKPYTSLEYVKKEILNAAPGTKSVVFNSTGSRLYAMNLEGMSVYEFDRATRKILREFKFKPTRGSGWDYAKSRPVSSFQEKPVEACLSHNDEILWISLHNAEGIVPIWLNQLSKNRMPAGENISFKPITVIYPSEKKKDSFQVPLIVTGKTPKVIARTGDSRYLLGSNWHSKTVSVLQTDTSRIPYATIIQTIPVSAIPRGMAVNDAAGKSYVAIMGGASVTVLNNSTWQKETDLNVWSSPRHLVMDAAGRLFVSYNSLGTVACLDGATGQTLFSAKTNAQPRTFALSKNHKFLFVTCYSSDKVDVFRIQPEGFEKLISLSCGGHPVGVDIYENDDTLEAWVCSYSNGSISIFSFRKK
ncbi:MAG: YncE family protein [Chitinophagaceae bacterium]|nr:YncE family protein [Chitinophagaceae bacterium]